jgi:hypothetical protein
MKLNPEDLEVVTFATAASSVYELPTIDVNDPTPATHCDDCLSPTIDGCY